jgi:hypothetical protein
MSDVRRWSVQVRDRANGNVWGVDCLTERSYSDSSQFGRMIALQRGQTVDVKLAAPAEPFPALILGRREIVQRVEWDADGFVWVRVTDDSQGLGTEYRRVTRDEWREAEWSIQSGD